MDMDFPHPRKAAQAGQQKSDYISLVASATARQANSRTVCAMLTTKAGQRDGRDFMGSRIAFFASSTPGQRGQFVGGAFWTGDTAQQSSPQKETLISVNLADSTKGNADGAEQDMPAMQGTKWGTEL